MIDIHAHVTTNLNQYRQRATQAGVALPIFLATAVHPESATTLAELRTQFGGLTRTLAGEASAEDAFRRSQDEVQLAVESWPGAVSMRKMVLDWPRERMLAAADQASRDPRTVGLGELTPAGGNGGAIESVVMASAETAIGRPLPVLVHGVAPNTAADLESVAAIARRYREVPIIIGAFGGLNSLAAVELAVRHQNLYLDLSSAMQVFAVRVALHELPERCLFGSNTPYGDVLAARATLEAATQDLAVRTRAGETNARQLFGLD